MFHSIEAELFRADTYGHQMTSHYDAKRDAVIYACTQCEGEVVTDADERVIGMDVILMNYCPERDRVLAEIAEKESTR